MPRTKVAIVGLGMAVQPHARSLLDLEERVEVAHAFSPSESRRRAFAATYPFPLAESFEAILEDPTVQAVILLTPPNTHLDLARRVAAAGKHVLLEKPLEITSARAVELVGACRAAGVRLGVVLQHRYRPSTVKLMEILASGRLGAIAGASGIVRLWRPQSYYDEPGRGTKARDGGGVLLTQAIHTLDLFVTLAGQPVEVSAYARTSPLHRMETEDMVAAAVRFECGALGTIDATTAAFPGFPERIELICEHGSAMVAGTELSVHYHDGTTESLASDQTAGGTGADPMDFPHDYHRSLIADFLDAIEADRDPPITGEEALKVHRLIDALLESAEAGRPVPVVQD